ncbi:uncharacterized protein LOC141612716 [Silene latifolia]|uniref:uncharacterized protein LOC141612716 n=1 Tax=Silene latifolia TaxID=37657 RepID=UPI003D77E816
MQSKSREASGSDKTLDILVSRYPAYPRSAGIVSPRSSRLKKRKREDVILEEEEGDKEPIQAQPLRSIRQVPARVDDMDDARARIDEFSAKMSDQLLSANTLESSTRVVSILTFLASQAREGLDAGLATACQLRDAQAKVANLEEKLDRLNRDLHTSRGNEVVLQSQLGTAKESVRAAIVCEVAAKNAEKVARQELEAERQAMQDQLRKNEELAAEKELVEARLAIFARYFFGKGRVDAMRDPESTGLIGIRTEMRWLWTLNIPIWPVWVKKKKWILLLQGKVDNRRWRMVVSRVGSKVA